MNKSILINFEPNSGGDLYDRKIIGLISIVYFMDL